MRPEGSWFRSVLLNYCPSESLCVWGHVYCICVHKCVIQYVVLCDMQSVAKHMETQPRVTAFLFLCVMPCFLTRLFASFLCSTTWDLEGEVKQSSGLPLGPPGSSESPGRSPWHGEAVSAQAAHGGALKLPWDLQMSVWWRRVGKLLQKQP